MSRKRKAAVILFVALTLVIGAFLFVLIRPARWSQEIVTYLNQNVLNDNGWSIAIESLDGRFTSDVYLKNLYLRKEDGSAVVFSQEARVNLDFSRILTGDWAITSLLLEDGFITVRTGGEGAGTDLGFVDKFTSHGFGIRELSLTNTSLIIQTGSGEDLYSFDFNGEVVSRGRSLAFVPERIRFQDVGSRRSFRISDGEIALTRHTVSATGLKGDVNEIPFELEGSVTLSTPMKWVVNATGKQLALRDYVDRTVADVLRIDTVDVRVELISDLVSGTVRGSLFPHGRDSLLGQGSLDLEKEGRDLRLNQVLVTVGSSRLTGGGILRDGRDLSLQLRIEGFDLSEFGISANPTSIGGSADLSGTVSGRNVEHLSVVLDLINGEEGKDGFARSRGELKYSDGEVTIADSLRIDLGYGTLHATGGIDLENQRVDLAFTPSNVDLGAVGFLVGVDSLRGTVGGALELVGYTKDPIANGYLTIQDGQFAPMSASSLEASFRVSSVFGNPHGFLRAVVADGRIGDYVVEEGTADLYFRGDTLVVQRVRLTSGRDFFQVSGRMVGNRSFQVNQVQLSLGDHFITSLGPVAIDWTPGRLEIRPATLKIDDGTAQVSFSLLNGYLSSGNLRLANLDLATLWMMMDRHIPLEGAAFADVSARTEGDYLTAEGMFEIREGAWKEIRFDNLLMTGSLDENVLEIKEFSVTGPQDLSLKLSGFAHVVETGKGALFEFDPLGEVGFSSEFREFRLGLLSALWPGARIIGGSATGSLVVTGLSSSPDMAFQFTVQDPRLDRISGDVVSVSGRYDDRRLYIEDLVAETATGRYTANGYVPVNLALGSNQPERILKTDPVSMTFHGETSRLSFLTPYLSSVDSVAGDTDFDLTISGTPADPIRNGRVHVKDATVYAFRLDSPIEHVNGNAVLEGNRLIIDELVASSDVPPKMDLPQQLKSNLSSISRGVLFGETRNTPSRNLRVTGSMDLTEFFNPDLSFLVMGKNVYVRTLLGEIEGIADMKLSVTGKDTVSVAGDIVPRQAVLRIEFSSEEDYSEVVHEGPRTTHYLVHFPIESNVMLRNSQIDAELSGDITIQKMGSSPIRYSGELDLLSGKFYYYSDVFDIQEGHLVFDPSEFNPRMDIHATTTIQDIDIGVSLTGTFEEPIMLIEDSEQYYSQSQLLQLLTIQKQFNEQDLSTRGLGDQSVYLFGRFLESELERSLVRSTPLLDEFEIEGSSSLLSTSGDRNLALKVGTRFSPNLYLSYKQSFSLTEPSQVGVEYRLSPNVSWVVKYDDDGYMHLKFRRKYKF